MVETFHDQVGYWLWNPVEQTVTQTIAIPRAQVALASGAGVAPDATEFDAARRARVDDLRDLLEPVPRAGVHHGVVPASR